MEEKSKMKMAIDINGGIKDAMRRTYYSWLAESLEERLKKETRASLAERGYPPNIVEAICDDLEDNGALWVDFLDRILSYFDVYERKGPDGFSSVDFTENIELAITYAVREHDIGEKDGK